MTSKWIIYTLDELYTISSGLSKKREEFGFGYPFLTFKEVFHNPFVPNSLPELANTTDKERESCSIKRGDVFLTRTSEKLEELGLSSIALRDYPSATFNGFTKRLRPNEKCVELLIPEYVAFYLRSNEFRNQVTSFASMTTRASLNNEMIAKLTIKVPPLAIQKQITRVMVNLLQKEESNKKTVHLLEQIAQTLFNHWFLEFQFPNEEGLPYKSSGGKMVESELGEIPDGWSIKEIKDILTLKRGYDLPSKSRIPGTNPIISSSGVNGSHNISKVNGPGVVTGRSGQLGNVFYVVEDFWPLNTTLYVEKNNVDSHLFCYFLLKTLDFQALNAGSSVPTLNRNHVHNIKVVSPTNRSIKLFNKVVQPMFNKIHQLRQENHFLVELRDSLLPKLLSGEIEIPNESVADLCV